MKVLFTGGGTAGHVTPNLAIIEKLKNNGTDVVYIGTEDGIEHKLVTDKGIRYKSISAGKLRRYVDLKNITDIFKILKGFGQSIKHIRAEKPDVVFSKGGFVSCPVVWAARLNKIPVIIHESDITPGLANKLSIPFATKICYANQETAKYLPKDKSILTGIPIREELYKGDKNIGLETCGFDKKKPVILVIGGSLGARAINEAIRANLTDIMKKYQVCHIVGDKDYVEDLSVSGYKQFKYVNNELADIYAMSDLVISRAGATTLFEILNLEKPNILIPLPKAVSRGDQILNAQFFSEQGFSDVLDEGDLTSASLLNQIESTFKSTAKMTKAMRNSSLKNSSDVLVNLISETIKKDQ